MFKSFNSKLQFVNLTNTCQDRRESYIYSNKKIKQGTGPTGKGGEGGKGGKGKTGKTGKTGKLGKGGKGKMPPPTDDPMDDPKTIIGNKSDSVRRCDQYGTTSGNAATDAHMAVGRRIYR